MEPDKKYQKIIIRVASNIKRIRKQNGLTQEGMTEFGFSYRHFQKIESGKYSPNLHTLYRVAAALKVDIRDLFE